MDQLHVFQTTIEFLSLDPNSFLAYGFLPGRGQGDPNDERQTHRDGLPSAHPGRLGGGLDLPPGKVRISRRKNGADAVNSRIPSPM